MLALLTAAPAARAAQAAVERLRIRDLYARGAEFSDKAQSLSGQEVVIQGFMAPPLKADAAFFVLTKLPMAVCPFCDSELNWPTDIVLVRLHSRQDWVDFNLPILVTGRLELGTEIDQETGFVSRVRLVEAEYELA
jgi:hypothetical protein